MQIDLSTREARAREMLEITLGVESLHYRFDQLFDATPDEEHDGETSEFAHAMSEATGVGWDLVRIWCATADYRIGEAQAAEEDENWRQTFERLLRQYVKESFTGDEIREHRHGFIGVVLGHRDYAEQEVMPVIEMDLCREFGIDPDDDDEDEQAEPEPEPEAAAT